MKVNLILFLCGTIPLVYGEMYEKNEPSGILSKINLVKHKLREVRSEMGEHLRYA